MAFRGTFHHSLDAKNRLTVPARFRDAFSEGMVIVKGFDPCVELWRPDEYDAHVEQATANFATQSPQMRATLRLMEGSAFDTLLDKVGRVGLTAELMEHGGLGKDVVLVGVRRAIELWDKTRYDAAQQGLTAEVNAYASAVPHPLPPQGPAA